MTQAPQNKMMLHGHKVYAFFIYLTEGTVSPAPASITSVEWTTAGCGVDSWKCQSAESVIGLMSGPFIEQVCSAEV